MEAGSDAREVGTSLAECGRRWSSGEEVGWSAAAVATAGAIEGDKGGPPPDERIEDEGLLLRRMGRQAALWARARSCASAEVAATAAAAAAAMALLLSLRGRPGPPLPRAVTAAVPRLMECEWMRMELAEVDGVDDDAGLGGSGV
jgi:hypothetical protein